jgi:putative transposase
VSDVTIYNWKGRYGEMEVSQLRRLKDLESENARLKRMFADLSLTHHALQDAVEKAVSACAPSELVQVMVNDHGISVRQACRAARLARSAFYARGGHALMVR